MLELQRSNDELERFAYVASHDLSEPLRMIAGYMALLRPRYSPLLDDDGREFIAYAVDGAERMKRLIDDLLLYWRTGRTANPPQALSLESLMGDVTRNLERLIEEKGATVEIAQLPTVLGDRTMLTQLLQNLVGNALKFAANGRNPVVRVACETDGAGWRVGIADNGIGIEPRYFEPHLRALPAAPRARPVRGHGHRARGVQEDRGSDRWPHLVRVGAGKRHDVLLHPAGRSAAGLVNRP